MRLRSPLQTLHSHERRHGQDPGSTRDRLAWRAARGHQQATIEHAANLHRLQEAPRTSALDVQASGHQNAVPTSRRRRIDLLAAEIGHHGHG